MRNSPDRYSRKLVLDIEATGFGPGHRITEIGCIEIVDLKITGSSFHAYVNPNREVSHVAHRLTGLTWKFLRNYPVFTDVSEKFLRFIENAELIMHSASSDLEFINNELALHQIPYGKLEDRHKITDTIPIAEKLHPKQKISLDALCQIYQIDSSHRTKHGALIDAQLLARVYLAMLFGDECLHNEHIFVAS